MLLQPVNCDGFVSIRKLKRGLIYVIIILRLAITHPWYKCMNIKKVEDFLQVFNFNSHFFFL